MQFLRSSKIVFILFIFISMGQGFSFSYVINQPKSQDIQMQEGVRAVPAHLLVCGRGFQKILRENPSPHQKTHEELLSLRSDPFVPSLFSQVHPFAISVPIFEKLQKGEFIDILPESPPPKIS